jgi:TetR/AcrR family transcriptional regulator, mexJK operon transcriptional repressor
MLGNIPLADDGRTSALRRPLKKRQILDGARQVFLLNGYARASMDEIAVQAGRSKGTLYNHFDSKDDLFRSLIHAEAERITQEMPPPILKSPIQPQR